MQLKIKLLDGGVLPTKAYVNDAGHDVYSSMKNYVELGPGERHKFPLGFAIEIPPGFMGLIQGKSGLAAKKGITTIGNVIDSGYRGELHAVLLNTSQKTVIIEPGTKIAQLIIFPCVTETDIELVSDLSDGERGDKGFGSSGLYNPSAIKSPAFMKAQQELNLIMRNALGVITDELK